MVIRILLYALLGLAIGIVDVWYVRRLWKTFWAPKSPDTIAPFELIGKDDKDGASGSAMARMLYARLDTIKQEIEAARRALETSIELDEKRKGDEPPVIDVVPGERDVLTRELRSRIPTRLYSVPKLTLSVQGIELGGIVSWVQRSLSNDRLMTVVVSYGSDKAHVGAKLGDEPDQGLWMTAKRDDDDIVSKVGYALWQREMKSDVHEVSAFDLSEFENVMQLLVKYGKLSEQYSSGNRDVQPWKDLVATAQGLAKKAPLWEELQQVAAVIAWRSGDAAGAAERFEAAQRVVQAKLDQCKQAPGDAGDARSREVRCAELQERLDRFAGAVARLRELIESTKPPEGAATAASEETEPRIDAPAIEPVRDDPVRVAVFGGVPPPSMLRNLRFKPVDRSTTSSNAAMDEYVGNLSQTVAMQAPKTPIEFLYAPLPEVAATDSSSPAWGKALESLIQAKPDILLYGMKFSKESESYLRRAAESGIVVIASAGNDGDKPVDLSDPDLAKDILIVSAVDRSGRPTPWSQSVRESIWVRGDNLPLATRPGRKTEYWSGTGPASAAATASMAQLIASTGDAVDSKKLIDALRRSAKDPERPASKGRKERQLPDSRPVIRTKAAIELLKKG
jgi:Subtilase family